MSNIKSANASFEPAVNIDKDLPLVKQQPEIRIGETLIQEIAKASSKQQEKAQPPQTDTEQERPKDSAEISEVRRRFPTDGTVSADKELNWILEQEGKNWESFLEWQPDTGLDLPNQLQELSKLYLALLEAALKYAEGENLTEQMQRLDTLLAQKLNLMMDQALEPLTSLLEETGQSKTLDIIRSSLYRQTAGRTISPQAAHTLFTRATPAGSRTMGVFGAPSPFSGEGMVYQSSGKQNIRFQQAYHTQQNSWKEQIRQRNEVIGNARKGVIENTFKQGSSVSCSGKELERANGLAAHIGGNGNLFKNPGISARNEEVTGLLAAVMSIKGQVYAGGGRRSSFITLALENAIEKIIRQYLGPKGASKVYYHTLAAYKQMQNPHKAIQEGQDFAYRQFREKQADPAYQKSPQYSKESGFFRTLPKNLSPERGFAMGVDILQKDWQNFLYAIGSRQNFSYLSRMEAHSPWGALAGIGAHLSGPDGNIGKILLGIAVVTIMATLAVICFRLI